MFRLSQTSWTSELRAFPYPNSKGVKRVPFVRQHDDVFQRVELQQQSVIQTDEFHHLIVVQYIRLQYPLHGTVHAYRRDIEKVAISPVFIRTLSPVATMRLSSSTMIVSRHIRCPPFRFLNESGRKLSIFPNLFSRFSMS